MWGSLGPQLWHPRAELGMRTLRPANWKLWGARPPLSQEALGPRASGVRGGGDAVCPGDRDRVKAAPERGGDHGPQVAPGGGLAQRTCAPVRGRGQVLVTTPTLLSPREALGPCWGGRGEGGGGLGYGIWFSLAFS